MRLKDILVEFGERPNLNQFYHENYDAHLHLKAQPEVAKVYELLHSPLEPGKIYCVDMDQHAQFGTFMRAANVRFSDFSDVIASEGDYHFFRSKRHDGLIMMEQPKTGHMTYFFTHELLNPPVTEAKKEVDDDKEEEVSMKRLPTRFFVRSADAYRMIQHPEPQMQLHARRVYDKLFNAAEPATKRAYAITKDSHPELFAEMERRWAPSKYFPVQSKRFDQQSQLVKSSHMPIYRVTRGDKTTYWYGSELKQ